MNTEIKEMLDELYSSRETWGSATLAKTFQKHGLHIGGEKTINRAAEVLSVPYVELFIGGHKCKSYPKESAAQIFKYILNTNKAQRTADWLKLHPDVALIYSENKRKSIEKVLKEKAEIKNASLYLKCWEAAKTLKITKYKFIEFCTKLDIHINDDSILKTDFEKIKKYLEDNYSSDPYIRGRQMAIDKWNSSENKEERYSKTTGTRSENVNKARVILETELGIKCYTPKEAAEYIGKNNSTLISGMQLLGLPMYKRNGSYLYDEESLKILKNFYLNKNGLKGQLARVFEQKIRDEKHEFLCEKTFSDCCWRDDSKHPLRFDYYFPKYNLVVEVQGSQHFRPSSMGADMTEEEILETFNGLKERDAIKKQYCQEHNINFIEIIKKDDFKKFDDIIYKIKLKEINYESFQHFNN